MEKVCFQPIFHNNKEQIALYFERNDLLNRIIKQIAHAKCSHTHNCWCIPLTKQHCALAYKILSPHAAIDIASLQMYLRKRKHITDIKQVTGQKPIIKPSTLQVYAISDNNLLGVDKMVKTLQLKAYGNNTIELYRGENY